MPQTGVIQSVRKYFPSHLCFIIFYAKRMKPCSDIKFVDRCILFTKVKRKLCGGIIISCVITKIPSSSIFGPATRLALC